MIFFVVVFKVIKSCKGFLLFFLEYDKSFDVEGKEINFKWRKDYL